MLMKKNVQSQSKLLSSIPLLPKDKQPFRSTSVMSGWMFAASGTALGWAAGIIILLALIGIWLWKRYVPVNPNIHEAAKKGDAADIKRHLRRGIDANSKTAHNATALHYAAHYGHHKAVNILLRKGALVNARTQHSATPLRMAVEKGHTEVADLLRRYGGEE